MKVSRIAFGLILIIPGSVVFAAQWTQASTGLTGSVPGVSVLVIDDSTGSTLYALTLANTLPFDNTVFRSRDGGTSWSALGTISGTQVLALDPTSASTVYAGTRRGVFKSTNGGDSWVSTGLTGTSVSLLAIDPITPSTIYAASAASDNLYKSTDAGASWTAFSVRGHPPGLLDRLGLLMLDPTTPSTLYVVAITGPDYCLLYKSTDAGQSWNLVYSGLVRLLGIDPSTTPSTLWAIVPPGLAKSTDTGTTWVQTGFMQDVVSLAIDPADPKTVYAAASTGSSAAGVIFKSADGGQSWDSGNKTLPFVGSLVLSPSNSALIYAATATSGIFKSTDAGSTWSTADSGLNLPDIEVVVGDPVNPATIYAGGNSGLFKSTDRGGSWSLLETFQITCCAPPPGPAPGVPPPPSATPPFPPVASAPVISLLIDFTNPNILYAGTTRIGGCYFLDVLLYKSTDGGATWSSSINPSNSGCSTDGLVAMDPKNPNTLYLRYGDDYDGWGLWKTMDAGASWGFTTLDVANGLGALVIDPTNPAILYAGTDSTSPDGASVTGSVQKSSDGGVTWKMSGLANQDVNLLAINPLQPNVLYAGVTNYANGCCFQGLFKSSDSGANWSPINNGLGDVIAAGVNANALILDPDHPDVLYLATSGYGVFKSFDGGAAWAAFNDGLSFLDVRSLAIVRGVSPAVFAGTPGGVFKSGEQTTGPARPPRRLGHK